MKISIYTFKNDLNIITVLDLGDLKFEYGFVTNGLQ